MNASQRPGDHECFDYHRDYVAKVPDGDILVRLREQQESIPAFIRNLPVDQWDVVHKPWGWSVQTVIQHCVDAERVFGYRALRFATADQVELPGWDESHYASCGYSQPASPTELAEEYRALRTANLGLLQRLSDAAWSRIGLADGRQVSVRTIAWLMAGHWIHHHAILQSRLQSAWPNQP